MRHSIVELTKMVELENHDSLIQPAACGQGISGLDLNNLDITHNRKITNVSFMKHLKNFHVSHNHHIKQNDIDELDLIELSVNNNIKNVSFVKNLKILRAIGSCGINQNSICG
jgi:hypothetical protein